MKSLKERDFRSYAGRAKQSAVDHPVITSLIIIFIIAAITATIIAIYKLTNKDDDVFEEPWDLEEDDNYIFAHDEE